MQNIKQSNCFCWSYIYSISGEKINQQTTNRTNKIMPYPARERSERAGQRPEHSLCSQGCYSKKYTPHTLWRSCTQPLKWLGPVFGPYVARNAFSEGSCHYQNWSEYVFGFHF